MQEKLRHQEAFDYYYGLSEERSLAKVARKFKVSVQSLAKWSKNFNWQARVHQRDVSIARKMQAETDRMILDTKITYRENIAKVFSSIKNLLKSVEDEEGNLLLIVESVGDFQKVVNTFIRMVTLDVGLMSESEQKNLEANAEREEQLRKLSKEQRRELLEHYSSIEEIINSVNQEN